MERAVRFVTYRDDAGHPTLGVIRSDRVVKVTDILRDRSPLATWSASDVAGIAGDPAVLDAVAAALHGLERDAGQLLVDIEILPPVVAPTHVIGVGLNYRSHAEEQGARIPRQPVLFAKWSTSVAAHGARVSLPYLEAQVDYEGEVAVIIGRGGRDIRAEDARQHIFGISAMNDLSDRATQLAERQWTRSKSFDGFGPLGPTVVTIDEFPSLDAIGIRTSLNGEIVQQGSTADLIFDIPALVAFASQGTTLMPGDVIATGTPSGVGFVKEPPVYLAPGDIVTVMVEHVGDLTTTIVGPPVRTV